VNLERLTNNINQEFNAKNQAREKALSFARWVIQASSSSIRAIHQEKFEKAEKLLGEAKSKLEECDSLLKGYPDIYYAGFLQDAQKEYVEASATLCLILGKPLPDPDDLKVGYASFLNGMGEAVGELRRHILDIIRKGDLERGEQFLESMDEIYYLLLSFDYPEAIIPGLRRITDFARSVMERTRGDLTNAISQDSLKKALSKFKENVK
jgi:translin